jgi:hypothetical protein
MKALNLTSLVLALVGTAVLYGIVTTSSRYRHLSQSFAQEAKDAAARAYERGVNDAIYEEARLQLLGHLSVTNPVGHDRVRYICDRLGVKPTMLERMDQK